MLQRLKEKSGFSTFQGIVTLLCMVMLLAVLMQALRCFVIIRNVDDSLQAGTNRVGIENMHNASKGLREGGSAAYVYDPAADAWQESVMSAQLTELVKADLSLKEKEGRLVLETETGLEYALSDIEIRVENAQLAGGNSETLNFETTAILEIPFYALGTQLPPIRLERTVKTTFTNKY